MTYWENILKIQHSTGLSVSSVTGLTIQGAGDGRDGGRGSRLFLRTQLIPVPFPPLNGKKGDYHISLQAPSLRLSDSPPIATLIFPPPLPSPQGEPLRSLKGPPQCRPQSAALKDSPQGAASRRRHERTPPGNATQGNPSGKRKRPPWKDAASREHFKGPTNFPFLTEPSRVPSPAGRVTTGGQHRGTTKVDVKRMAGRGAFNGKWRGPL